MIPPFQNRGEPIFLDDEVDGQRVARRRSLSKAFVGDVAHPEAAAAGNAEMADLPAGKRDRAGRHHALAGKNLGQVFLAIAVDTGDAHDLSGLDLEIRAIESALAPLSGGMPATELKERLHPGIGALPALRFRGVADEGGPEVSRLPALSEHHRHDPSDDRVRRHRDEFGGLHLADNAPLAQHRYAVGEIARLLQLVGDEDDGDTMVAQPAHDDTEIVDALGCQHRRRFIEEEDQFAVPQGAHDLDLLLFPQGEPAHRGVRRHPDGKQFGQFGESLGRGGTVKGAPPRASQHQVFEDAQARDEQDVLIDRADAQAQGGGRRRDPHRPAGHFDGAGVRAHHAGNDADERGLAGAVLAQQGMNLAAPEDQRHPVVCEDAGESPGDAVECEGGIAVRRADGIGFHPSTLLTA